jgi:diguanylate cyclase
MAKILIVDDDHETISLLSSLIQSIGHEPASESVSRNAIDTAYAVRPDLVLMDIMMHEVNGIELTRMFKSDPQLSSIPIVMVSALNDPGSKRDSFNAGALDFITKPIKNKDFKQRILEIVGD